MNIKEILAKIIMAVLPYIKELIVSEVVPRLQRKAYQRLDDFVNDRVESLEELLYKIKNTEDDIKRKAHLEGFKLGISTLQAISIKLNDACNVLQEAVSENG